MYDSQCYLLLCRHSFNLRRSCHFHGTNQVLFPDVCQPISRYLSGENMKEETKREFINYIFANSECLKRAGFSLKSTSNHKDRKKMKDLESMYRVSASSQLLFSTHVEYMSVSDELRA